MTTPVQLFAHAQAVASPLGARALISEDPESRALLEYIEHIAPFDATVLITGETGTGKELVAHHIHASSKRSGPFVAVNCGALSQSLAEAELFGHKAGAFTGATETRAGWFESANNGTLFLDEVAELPLAMQVKLLRVIQEREVVRVGSRSAVPLNVRLIAATNIDLARAVESGEFRNDLYYRLHVATIELAPLRKRRADIVPLFDHFAKEYARRMQKAAPLLLPESKQILLQHEWPGNIRELENAAHVAVLLARDGAIRPRDLRLLAKSGHGSSQASNDGPFDAIAQQLRRLFAGPAPDLYLHLEELIFRQAFDACGRNQVQTARLLGISRNVLRTQLKQFGLIGDSASDSEFATLSGDAV
jgi:sigma-54-specific transcriptional regulator